MSVQQGFIGFGGGGFASVSRPGSRATSAFSVDPNSLISASNALLDRGYEYRQLAFDYAQASLRFTPGLMLSPPDAAAGSAALKVCAGGAAAVSVKCYEMGYSLAAAATVYAATSGDIISGILTIQKSNIVLDLQQLHIKTLTSYNPYTRIGLGVLQLGTAVMSSTGMLEPNNAATLTIHGLGNILGTGSDEVTSRVVPLASAGLLLLGEGAYSAFHALTGHPVRYSTLKVTGPDGQTSYWDRPRVSDSIAHIWRGIDPSAPGTMLLGAAPYAATGGNVPRGGKPGKTALNTVDLIDELDEPCDSPNDTIRLQRHVSPDGSRSWTVLIPGTKHFTFGGVNPTDMETNLQEVANVPSDQQVAVQAALRQAGAQPGDTIEVAGFSQSAAVASAIASSEYMNNTYNIVSTLAVGGPSSNDVPVHPQTVLALQNTADAVPALDGSTRNAPGVITVDSQLTEEQLHRATGTPEGGRSWVHSREAYQELVRQNTGDPRIQDWEQRRREEMGLSERTVTTNYDFQIERTHEYPTRS